MGIVNLYKGLESFRDIYNFNGKIKDNLDLNWAHVKIYKGEAELTPDYEVQEHDVIIVHEHHAGATGLIIMAIVAVGVAIGSGVYASEQIKQAERDMKKALKRIGKKNER